MPTLPKKIGSTFNFEGGTITIDGGVASLGTALFFGGTSQANQPTLVLQNGATATGFGSTLGGSPGDFATLTVSGASATQPTSFGPIIGCNDCLSGNRST